MDAYVSPFDSVTFTRSTTVCASLQVGIPLPDEPPARAHRRDDPSAGTPFSTHEARSLHSMAGMSVAIIGLLIGRIMVGGYYIVSGIRHFKDIDMMTGYAQSKGVPAPKLAIAGSGLLLLIGGVSILIGDHPVIGIAAISLFLIGVTPMIHNFWAVSDPQQRMAEMINFTKNIALLGSTLMFLAIPHPWPFSLTG